MRISDWSSDVCSSDLPGDCSQEQQQGKAEETHEASRQTAGLFDAPQAVDVASGSVGTGVQVELLNQAILIQPQQLGIGTNVTPGKGVPWQLAEIAGLDASQRALGEIQLLVTCSTRPALVFASNTQRLAGVVAHRGSEEHTSELQYIMRISYADFCLKKKNILYNQIVTPH